MPPGNLLVLDCDAVRVAIEAPSFKPLYLPVMDDEYLDYIESKMGHIE